MPRVYKILGADEWERALRDGAFKGSEIDLKDGFIHLSGADQVEETARLYFSGRQDLRLLEIDAETLGAALKWEPSRGGKLFPHLYGDLPVSQVSAASTVALDAEGVPALGSLLA